MVDGRLLDFGTTGLLRFSNLVMYDRQTESWWQEFTGEAIVGELTGKKLEILPNSIVSWEEFKKAYPGGKVLSRDTGHFRPYGRNPYYQYDTTGPFMYTGFKDTRLSAVARVVTVLIGDEPLAVPFSVLEKELVVHFTLAGQDLAILFKKGTASALDTDLIAEGKDVGAVGVFDAHLEGHKLSFQAREGAFIDAETGSTWNIFGQAVSGPLQGKALAPVPHQRQFWFSWVVHKPNTIIYQGNGKADRLTS
jgi:hypothetical protein